jgi:hypothetical protein
LITLTAVTIITAIKPVLTEYDWNCEKNAEALRAGSYVACATHNGLTTVVAPPAKLALQIIPSDYSCRNLAILSKAVRGNVV